MDKQETLMIVVAFLAVFILAFSFTFWLNSQNATLMGFRVMSSKPPVEALQTVLDKNRSLILKQELTNGATRENSAVAALSAELIYAVQVTGINISNYGSINGVNINSSCNSNNSFCGKPDVVIGIDASQPPCNCIVVRENKTMEIRGSTQFFLENGVNLRHLIYYIESKQ